MGEILEDSCYIFISHTYICFLSPFYELYFLRLDLFHLFHIGERFNLQIKPKKSKDGLSNLEICKDSKTNY
ncbi:hypothetical protein JHK82_013997 [Glycine max]|uniref:Uncharacterized protein n=2 Tax=Glycine subgen. Soja TaxID=1462606 RepID=A0A0R0JDP8_SOYBN|nr:hypothetical protein JHK85_014371 [Glycine max]KAG5044616.1 hypothetical protein JHK86_014022 [Glycine max]KAG5147116.1 hypothetical protein JHK82_013997 [Glycine max]KAH1123546.1 hypothetical protein GYH30_013669 [Glycine max]RZC05132.1 hypothetical protein D0Y65_013347 [Glycine soja]